MATSTTPKLGLRYPDGTEAPNVPLWLSYLATDVDTILGSAGGDTGWIKTGLTYTNGYAESNPVTGYQSLRYRRMGASVVLNGVLYRPGSPVAVGDVMFNMAAGLRPVSTFISARCTIDPTGNVTSAFTFAAGQAFGIDLRYVIG